MSNLPRPLERLGRAQPLTHARMMAVVFAATVTLTSPSVYAAASAPSPGITKIETVVVTARKRPENAHDVPISVTTVSADQLARHGTNDLRDLDGMVPNMVETGLASNVNPLVSIRGISSDSRNIGFESGVAVYIDGVYTGRPTSYEQDLLDTEQVEILRGPQGTLFGKNTTAGVINITTTEPSDEFSAIGKLEIGNYGLFREQATITGPIADDLSGKISLYAIDHGGIQTDLFNGLHYWNEHQFGGRTALHYQPTDELSITLSFDGLSEHNRMPQSHVTSGLGSGGGPFDINTDAPVFEKRDIFGGSLNADYSFPGAGVLTSISAYRSNRTDYLSDDDATFLPILFSHFTDDEHQVSQELRYASPATDRLNYVVGFYFYDQTVQTFRSSTLSVILPGSATVSLNAHVQTIDYAVFGQANYRLTDALTLTAGARYTHESKALNMNLVGFPPFGIINLVTTQSKDSGAFSPMGSLVYRVSDNLNAYVTVSRGFKAGGYNADFVGNSDLSFGAETVTNYEGGLKYANDMFEIDATGYHMDYNNLQVSTFVPLVGFVITNAASAKINGAEFDLTAVPFQGLQVTSGLGYNDATFDKYRDGMGGVFDGNYLAYAPRFTFSLSAEYAVPVIDLGTFRIYGEFTDRSSYFSRTNNDPIFLVSGYALFNGRLSLDSEDGHWSVQFWGRNLLDKTYVDDRDQPFGGNLGSTSASYGMPRTFGVDFLVRT